MSLPVAFKPISDLSEGGWLYLSARFLAIPGDGTNAQRSLAILASPSPTKMGRVVKNPAYYPTGGNLRDPSITYFKGRYYVAYTAGVYGAVPYFVVIGSDNLVDWEHVADVMVDMGGKTWAPEFFVDGETLYVTVGCNDSWPTDGNFYLLEALSDDLTEWAEPVEITGFGAPVNDSCLRRIGSTYHLVCGRTAGYMEFWTASSITGPYSLRLSGNHSGWGNVMEGSCLVNLGGSRWMITGDALDSGCYSYYAISEDDMETWSTLSLVQQPGGLRHGSTVRLEGGQHFRIITDALIGGSGNLHHAFLESTDFAGGIPAGLGVELTGSNRAYYPYFGFKYGIGWFLSSYKGGRPGANGSWGANTQDWIRFGFDPVDPISILYGLVDQNTRANLGGVIKTIHAAVQSVTTTPTDLHSFTVPAYALFLNGQSIVHKTSGRFSSGTANAKECKLYVNGTEVATTGSSAHNGTAFSFELTITRRGDTSAHLLIEVRNGTASSVVAVDATITLSGTFVIKTVGIATVTGDVISDYTQTVWNPRNP